jgi:hypothetical protein
MELMNDRLFTTNYLHSWGDDEHGPFIPENASRDMNLYKIEQMKAEAIARCRKRLEMSGKTDVILTSSQPSVFSLRAKHGL